ncbi:peptide chain release factor [Salmonella enterica subsp. enterica]|uniref:Peptide chain release factor n=1 Tax=Salmonella enterica I TaxID=59201 RepID=A0A447U9B3_SALET|nr:peptide chain release factor [Salmonella enterica subsp. enterica]
MILLQLSSAQGPDECCLAVKKALDCLTKEAAREKVSLTRLETEPGRLPDTLRSALVSLDGEKAMAFSERWCGTLLWICTSPYRPHHGRKNWYVGIGALFRRRATYSLMRFVSRLCALPARVGSTLIKPTRQCGPRTW